MFSKFIKMNTFDQYLHISCKEEELNWFKVQHSKFSCYANCITEVKCVCVCVCACVRACVRASVCV